MVIVDATAKRYGIRPSQLLQISDAFVAFQFDVAVAFIGISEENDARENARQNSGGRARNGARTGRRPSSKPNRRATRADWLALARMTRKG
jgi:hypothetical protein